MSNLAPVDTAPDTGAVLRYGADKVWGYLTLTIDQNTIVGKTTEIDRNGNLLASSDRFSYSARAITLADPTSVPTL